MTTQKMLSKLRKGISTYKMINDGDKIAVGISGGKDSVALLKLLAEYRRFSPEKFDLVAITIDLNFKGQEKDYLGIKELCDGYGIEYVIEKTQIGDIVFDLRKESSPCSLCSKMRKGALYDVATKKGANKVALGHHSNDLTETFLLSLFYEGRLSTFAPKSFLSKTGLTLIRPMIFLEENEVICFVRDQNLPVYKSFCPVNESTKRERVKQLINNLSKEEDLKDLKQMLFTALIHPDRYNLFDKFEKQIDQF